MGGDNVVPQTWRKGAQAVQLALKLQEDSKASLSWVERLGEVGSQIFKGNGFSTCFRKSDCRISCIVFLYSHM